MILVTGATGTAGSEVVRALLEQRRGVRVFVRDPGKARRLFGDAIELAQGDFADPRSLRTALDGVEDVFLSCGDDPRRVEWETGAIDAAAAAGVRRIVKLSSIVAESETAPVAFWDWHRRVEQHLRASGVPAVILRCSFFMSNLLAAADQVALGRLSAPAGLARIAMIDPRDVGAAAAAVLTSEGHEGRTFLLTGPEAITYAGVAAQLSDAIGRDVQFADIADHDATEAMVEAGMPSFVAEQICAIFAQARAGAAAQVTPAFEQLSGRRPRDFAAFARDHAGLFSPAIEAVGR